MSSSRHFLRRTQTARTKKSWRGGRQGISPLLYSDDIILEYEEKLAEKEIDENAAIDLIALMLILGEDVVIRFFLLKLYPSDPDDIHFLLCAINGRADYLVSGDNHLLELSSFYRSVVTICRPREFVNQTHP